VIKEAIIEGMYLLGVPLITETDKTKISRKIEEIIGEGKEREKKRRKNKLKGKRERM